MHGEDQQYDAGYHSVCSDNITGYFLIIHRELYDLIPFYNKLNLSIAPTLI
jgi:hypothetical protein